ncbi:hypothetical protein NB231_12616 [Nitrococcus mobilis Nb-231]|uniref:Transposase n=1 Tax=Nitrococcus mobilis Nb-231 TaxID=314278 RepID=A4BU58_9GAMM|nr:hypothetical protein NB231_12616 [Nitrococcus mobilis Nb-231]
MNYPVSMLCRVIQASRSGFYGWPRRRDDTDAERVQAIHNGHRGQI